MCRRLWVSGVPEICKDSRDYRRRSRCARGHLGALGTLQSSADNIGMVENLPATEELRAGGFQGKNDFGKIGYGGHCHRQERTATSSRSMAR